MLNKADLLDATQLHTVSEYVAAQALVRFRVRVRVRFRVRVRVRVSEYVAAQARLLP